MFLAFFTPLAPVSPYRLRFKRSQAPSTCHRLTVPLQEASPLLLCVLQFKMPLQSFLVPSRQSTALLVYIMSQAALHLSGASIGSLSVGGGKQGLKNLRESLVWREQNAGDEQALTADGGASPPFDNLGMVTTERHFG
eukprot:TRINITY_DN13075_c1_g1_i1.p1 TRINITY_DN13075_c1_g1~~TRINITY_DN13075_c1_g1_i1.p1  ORF type:complete len:138 (+),score=3.41 TRINITY_DN13075_c1_g1_i1:161-574(+)